MNKTAKKLAHCVSLWLAIIIAFPLLFVSCNDKDDMDDDAAPALDDAVLIDEDVDASPVGDELKVMTSGRAYVVPGDYIYSGQALINRLKDRASAADATVRTFG